MALPQLTVLHHFTISCIALIYPTLVVGCRHLLSVILPLLEALSRAPDVRPVLQAAFDMAGWFGRRGVCMYERPDRSLTAAATLAH